MSQLAFLARGDLLVSHPAARRIIGQIPRYVGRTSVIKDGAASHPATKQPFVCESGSDIARRLAKLTKRDSSLWPADEATARACGVKFVPVEFSDGVWGPAPTPDPKRSAASKSTKD